MREIVLDTETTGLDPISGHRMVEIGCIELLNRIPSGQTFHRYVNPERDVPSEAIAVHGITGAFLKDKPFFAEVADELLAFIADAPLVAHNAAFDLGFLNAELERGELPTPLVAALAHYQYATVHPYYDGNGRTARLLTTLVLHKAGYGLKGIYSLEEYYARDLAAYYGAPATGSVEEGKEARVPLSLKAGCYQIFAFSGDGLKGLDLSLADPAGKSVGTPTNGDGQSAIKQCVAEQGTYTLVVKSSGGSGSFIAQPYASPSAAGASPRATAASWSRRNSARSGWCFSPTPSGRT